MKVELFNVNSGRHLFLIMSTFLYTLLGLSIGTSLHCPVRREISPCSCRRDEKTLETFVTCEQMTSFGQVVDALQNRFPSEIPIRLDVQFSQLDDLNMHTFEELNMTITCLKLNNDNLIELPPETFVGLPRTDFFSIADNPIPAIPHIILGQMQGVKTLDIGRARIKQLLEDDFKSLPSLLYLILPGNAISVIEKDSLPHSLRQLHLGRNQILDLNGTLRYMPDLMWLFINSNQLKSIDDQFPVEGSQLVLIHASDNLLEHLPQDLRNLHKLESLFFENNQLTSLDGTLAKARKLQKLNLSHNRIQILTSEDFAECESLEDLQLGDNKITAINGSLLPLRVLRTVNLTHNALVEFSLQEIKGLKRLYTVDLSHNQINKLGGRMENVVERDTDIKELRLEYNLLQSLDGSLSGLHGLSRLNLSHNRLSHISPDDLIGLENLRVLDFSHNKLTTLEETSKTFLPSLEQLLVTHNMLTMLEHDFHGLPVLCRADLSYNSIRSISRDLVAHTRCNIHGRIDTLHLYLQDNPILCDNSVPELISDLEVNNTRLYGDANCTRMPLPPPMTIVSHENNSDTILTPHDEVLAKSVYHSEAAGQVVNYIQHSVSNNNVVTNQPNIN